MPTDEGAENPRAVTGDNQPPQLTPFEAARDKIELLHAESTGWLDGEPITTAQQAEDIATLKGLLRIAWTTADDARKVEVKPLNDAKNEVQGRYNPILGNAKAAIDACKKAESPYLLKVEREQREAAEALREEAEEKQRLAAEALATVNRENLAESQRTEKLLKDADEAQKTAAKAARAKPRAKGTVGRASSLRLTYEPEVDNCFDAVKHYWQVDPTAFEELVLSLAKADFAAGRRDIPGIKINEIRSVV